MRPRNLPILLHGSTVLRTYIQTTVLIVIHHKHRMNFLIVTDLNNSVDDDPPAENNEIDDTTDYKLRGGMTLVKRKRAKILRSVRFKKEKDPGNYYRE